MMSWSSGRLNKAAPKLGAIDLNLLVVFDAIVRDRSVTRAGHRLGLRSVPHDGVEHHQQVQVDRS